MTTSTIATNFSATTKRLCAAVMLAGALAASAQDQPVPAAAAQTNAPPPKLATAPVATPPAGPALPLN